MARMKKWMLLAAGCLAALNLWAELKKEFPARWGEPPAIQTRDLVELPGGYGRGSSTLSRWITAHLEKDRAAASGSSGAAATVLYRQDFQAVPVEKVPEDFMVLGGEFVVKADGTNQFLELPGAPLDSFAVQFGPGERENVTVSAKILGTAKGRRAPTFGVGLGGVSGFKLQVAPGKKALELLKDQEVKASVSYTWKSGAWTELRLQVRKLKDGEWRIEGKAWPVSEPEPKAWMITFEETEEPVLGKASVLGSPFSGTPIQFDDLVVEQVTR